MPRRVDLVLVEIEAALDGIESAVAGRTYDDFAESWLVRHAVQRALEIISEASRHLPDELLAVYPDIPWHEIRSMGNFLRHAYHAVDDTVVWSTVKDDLPALRAAIASMRGLHRP